MPSVETGSGAGRGTVLSRDRPRLSRRSIASSRFLRSLSRSSSRLHPGAPGSAPLSSPAPMQRGVAHQRLPKDSEKRPILFLKKMLVTGVTEVSHSVSLVPQSWRSRDRLYRHSHSLLDLRPFPALSAHGLSRRSPRGEIVTTRGIPLGTPARFRPVFVVQHRDLTAHGYHLCSLTDTIYWYKV